jgi:Icc-related predicted phosphoesterase
VKVIHVQKENEDAVRFVCLSDTHMKHRYIDVPQGDVLLLCGDLLIMDRGAEHGGIQQLHDINQWLGTLPHRYKLVLAGNHDRTIEELGKDGVRAIFTNATYLQDEEITLFGIRIYATPISIRGLSINHAFQYQRNSIQMQEAVNRIPEGIDILLTHGPALGYGDGNNGCRYLRERIHQIKPQYHIFGHIHTRHGVYSSLHTPTLFINAASSTFLYTVTHLPIVFDFYPSNKV